MICQRFALQFFYCCSNYIRLFLVNVYIIPRRSLAVLDVCLG